MAALEAEKVHMRGRRAVKARRARGRRNIAS